MSVKITWAAWQVPLPHAEKLVLLSLADNADEQGLCWPSSNTVAIRCGMHERTVRDIIGRLAEAGHVDIRARPGRSSYYVVTPGARPGVGSSEGQPPNSIAPAAAAEASAPGHSSQSATPGAGPGVPRVDDHPGSSATPGPAPEAPGAGPGHPGRRTRTPRVDDPTESVRESSTESVIHSQSSRARRATTTTATRLPADFVLSPARRTVAVAERLDAERTFAKFCDHWRSTSGSKARKCDWDAAWRNWCRTEADRVIGAGVKPLPADKTAQPEREALEKLMARREAIGLSGFRDPVPGESAEAYRQAQNRAWDAKQPRALARFGGEAQP